MIVVTGAAGFIGSAFIGKLISEGYKDIIAVDLFDRPDKWPNLDNKAITNKIERDHLIQWLALHHEQVQFVFHLGARTDTTEQSKEVFDALNLNYSKAVWLACAKYGIALVYASSAATYGDGSLGYNDNHELCNILQPLNPYGESKNDFDKWALAQTDHPYFWAGLKFFNVYGPNEYHKGRMASVVYHAFQQIHESGSMKLFKSHRSDFKDGEQKRDFVYVKDVCDVLMFLMHHRRRNDCGIYNLGTGHAETFLELSRSVFEAMSIPENISFIDTPDDIRMTYQYYTQADMHKLRNIGYDRPFQSLREGIRDYAQNYLLQNRYL